MSDEMTNADWLKFNISYLRLSLTDRLSLLLKVRKNKRQKDCLVTIELLLNKAQEYLAYGFLKDAVTFYALALLLSRNLKANR